MDSKKEGSNKSLNTSINNHPERVSSLQYYEDQWNYNRVEFPPVIHEIGKFERNNPGIAVNVLFNSKKGMHTTRRSELNRKCSEQDNLFMINAN